MLTLVTRFCQDVAQHVKGGEVRIAKLVQANRKTYARYKRAIRASAPPFVPYPSATEARGVKNISQYLQLDGDDEDIQDKPEAVDGVEDEDEAEAEQEPQDDDTLSRLFEAATQPKYLYLKDVRRHIQLSLSRELPTNVPYASKVTLIETFQDSWEQDSRECFDEVYRSFEHTLLSLASDRFKQYDHLHNNIV